MSLPVKGSTNIMKRIPCECNESVFEKLFEFRRCSAGDVGIKNRARKEKQLKKVKRGLRY